jgi:hypothetical protein
LTKRLRLVRSLLAVILGAGKGSFFKDSMASFRDCMAPPSYEEEEIEGEEEGAEGEEEEVEGEEKEVEGEESLGSSDDLKKSRMDFGVRSVFEDSVADCMRDKKEWALLCPSDGRGRRPFRGTTLLKRFEAAPWLEDESVSDSFEFSDCSSFSSASCLSAGVSGSLLFSETFKSSLLEGDRSWA